LSLDPFVDSLFEDNKKTVSAIGDGKPLGAQAQTAVNSFSTSKVKVELTKTQSKNQRYITATIKAHIWRRDNGCCQKCGSTRRINSHRTASICVPERGDHLTVFFFWKLSRSKKPLVYSRNFKKVYPIDLTLMSGYGMQNRIS